MNTVVRNNELYKGITNPWWKFWRPRRKLVPMDLDEFTRINL